MKSSQCTPDKAKRRPGEKQPSPIKKGKFNTGAKKPMRSNRPRGG